MNVRRLRTNYADRPLGIRPTPPVLSWEVEREKPHIQVAYQLEGAIAADDEAAFDTGWIEESTSVQVPWPEPVEPRERYTWRVRVRDADGSVSDWSEYTWFECGLAAADWEAEWIAAPATPAEIDPVPAMSESIEIDDGLETARLYVCGLGSYVPFLDGERFDDRELDPAFSDYDDRALYSTYDITDELTLGTHEVGVLLGRGRYAMATETAWKWREAPWASDRPHLIAQIELIYRDGRREVIGSDASWRATHTATQFDCLYLGEEVDHAEGSAGWPTEVPIEDWEPVEIVDGPAGELLAQEQQPMRIVDQVEPVEITTPAEDVFVFAFDELVVGWTAIALRGPEGSEVTLKHGEKLDEEGFVDVMQGHVTGQIQTDTCWLSDREVDRWESQFSYKGFRYVEIQGIAAPEAVESLTAKAVMTDYDTLESEFRCDNELLGRIHENVRRSLKANYQGTPTDSPTFEKNSWTGDVQLSAEATIYNFDMARPYRKWLADCADAQREHGELPCIVPTSDWGYEDSPLGGMAGVLPGWDAAYVLLPWWMYKYYGDLDVLTTHFDGMCRLVEHFHDHATDGVLMDGLGDWVPPGSGITADTMRPPEGPAITSTAYYYRSTELVAKAATVLGADEDSDRLRERCDRIKTAFQDRFFDSGRGIYATGEVDEYRQTSNLFPLRYGMVPEAERERVLENLLTDIEDRGGHLNTGILGTKQLLPTLTEHGHVDVAFEIATKRTYPSWGRWLEEGATSLYESWELNSRSRHHRSFASIDDWFYGYLAGIRPETPGFETVGIEPYHPTGLDSAGATVETLRGSIAVDWKRDGTEIRYVIDLPGNTRGAFHCPGTITSIDGPREPSPTDHPTRERGTLELVPGEWHITTTR